MTQWSLWGDSGITLESLWDHSGINLVRAFLQSFPCNCFIMQFREYNFSNQQRYEATLQNFLQNWLKFSIWMKSRVVSGKGEGHQPALLCLNSNLFCTFPPKKRSSSTFQNIPRCRFKPVVHQVQLQRVLLISFKSISAATLSTEESNRRQFWKAGKYEMSSKIMSREEKYPGRGRKIFRVQLWQ